MKIIYATLGIYHLSLGRFLGLIMGFTIHTLNCDSVCAAMSGSLAGIVTVFIAIATGFVAKQWDSDSKTTTKLRDL